MQTALSHRSIPFELAERLAGANTSQALLSALHRCRDSLGLSCLALYHLNTHNNELIPLARSDVSHLEWHSEGRRAHLSPALKARVVGASHYSDLVESDGDAKAQLLAAFNIFSKPLLGDESRFRWQAFPCQGREGASSPGHSFSERSLQEQSLQEQSPSKHPSSAQSVQEQTAEHEPGGILLALCNSSGSDGHSDYEQVLTDCCEILLQSAAQVSNAQQTERLSNKVAHLLDYSDAIYGSWNEKRDWEYHNVKALRKIGYHSEIDIRSLADNNPFHPDDWKAAYGLFQNLVKNGVPYEHDYRLLGKHGEQQWYHAKTAVTESNDDGSTRQFISISRNITDIVLAERQMQQQSQLEHWLVEQTNALFNCGDFEAISKVLAEVGSYMGLVRCTVRLLEPTTELCSLVAEWHQPELEPLRKLRPEMTELVGAGWIKPLIELGRTHIIRDYTRDTSARKIRNYNLEIGARASLTQPMIFEDQLTGFVALLSAQPRDWSAADLRIAKVITETLHMTVLKNRLLKELRASEERFQLAMESTTYGLWDHNVPDNTMYLSPHFYQTLGYAPDEMKASPDLILELTHPDDQQYLITETHRQYHPSYGDTIAMEFRQRRKDGSYCWVLCRGKVVKRDEIGRATRVMGVNMDISELKQTLTELRRARETAEKANRSKSEFLERMSHEIRTPMNAILGMTYLTLESDLHPEQRVFLQDIDEAAKSLLHVIDDILDFSKIESGELTIVQERFDLPQELHRIIKLMSLKAKQGENELSLTLAEDVPQFVFGDRNRLGQILTNLLSNAVKFTQGGSVSLSVQCADIDHRTNSASLLFSVKDSGIGLTEEQIQTLFEPFTQAEGSTTRKYGGTGLGLSICKHLVEMMGGSIHVISLPKVGTTFHFTIAFKQKASTESAETTAPTIIEPKDSEAIWAQHKSVLLVEDNHVNQRVAKGILRKFGIQVSTANNGQDALDLLRKSAPASFDAILMDIEMPVLNGLETTRIIRQDPQFSQLPIIAMTAHAMVGDREKCLEAGMNDHVPKPVNPANLQSVLRRNWA